MAVKAFLVGHFFALLPLWLVAKCCPLHLQRATLHLLEVLSLSYVPKLAVKTLIGPLECDRQKLHPVTKFCLPSYFQWALYQMGTRI